MRLSKPFKIFCSLFMGLLMSNIPSVAAAEAKMISTNSVLAEMDRAQAEKNLQDLVQREDVKRALVERGVSPEEVSSRLASLSEQELRQLSGQVDQARAGGTILVEILIIVLIIFLIRKM